MSVRRLSPTAATTQARKAARNRFRLVRLGRQPVDTPEAFAGRIAALLQAASHEAGQYSDAYAEHVVNRFSSRYLDLCRVAPIKGDRL